MIMEHTLVSILILQVLIYIYILHIKNSAMAYTCISIQSNEEIYKCSHAYFLLYFILHDDVSDEPRHVGRNSM
jgi:hypothetical protein